MVEQFTGMWLGFVGFDKFTGPDTEKSEEFDKPLREAMHEEAKLFFLDLLREDGAITEVFSAGYTYLNERLAKHDGIDGVKGAEIRRVKLEDATFAKLAGLPKLKALRLLKQSLADESFAVLSNWPDLEVFCIERSDWDAENAPADFMLHLNGLKNLRWLELKHLFGLDETRIDDLEGFPKLERLELDNASAQEECIAFLEKCPNLRDFELHRTRLGNEGIAKIVAALPKLERFDLKQNGAKDLDARCLKAVATLPNLRTFIINRWKDDQLFWEDGIEHLFKATSLQHLGDREAVQHPAVQRLLEGSPGIQPAQGRHYAVEFDYQAISG